MTNAARDGLIACVTRWLPVLDEPELRAVEGFVLELVIAARERAINLSARDQAATPVLPQDASRADAISRVELCLDELRDAPAVVGTRVAEMVERIRALGGHPDRVYILSERDADAIDTRPSIRDFDVGDLGGEGG